MKKILALFFMASVAFSQWLEIDKTHSDIKFVIKHLSISNINGHFDDYEAAIDFDAAKKRINSLEAIVKVDSIYTKNRTRDQNLTSEIFFDTQKFKSMTFKMTDSDDNRIYGILKIKDVSKNVVFDYTYNGSAKNINGSLAHSFTLKTMLKRREFNVGKDYPIEFIGDNVWITIDIEGNLRGDTQEKAKQNE
ncbi:MULTISPECIES: YceI family protein [unclassified Campylobacter]|uniref:YceI family protein n=1 Tax=unclassified Campylobacter TaxID=2593542 RepID=UPI003D331A2A